MEYLTVTTVSLLLCSAIVLTFDEFPALYTYCINCVILKIEPYRILFRRLDVYCVCLENVIEIESRLVEPLTPQTWGTVAQNRFGG